MRTCHEKRAMCTQKMFFLPKSVMILQYEMYESFANESHVIRPTEYRQIKRNIARFCSNYWTKVCHSDKYSLEVPSLNAKRNFLVDIAPARNSD